MSEVVSPEVKRQLVLYAERYESPTFIVGDPSWFMHQVDGDANREATAFVASCLSYGNRKQFMPKIQRLLDCAGGDMDAWIRSGRFGSSLKKDDCGCFYRLYSIGQMYSLLDAYRSMLLEYGSMGGYVRRTSDTARQAVASLCAFFAERGSGGIVPKDDSSACKRICMFLRWMVRSGSPVDLGLWSDFIDRRTLIMPLDTHVLSQACRLGLLHSRCASMSAAVRLTEALAQVFPDDPLRGDFALFGYGVDNK